MAYECDTYGQEVDQVQDDTGLHSIGMDGCGADQQQAASVYVLVRLMVFFVQPGHLRN